VFRITRELRRYLDLGPTTCATDVAKTHGSVVRRPFGFRKGFFEKSIFVILHFEESPVAPVLFEFFPFFFTVEQTREANPRSERLGTRENTEYTKCKFLSHN